MPEVSRATGMRNTATSRYDTTAHFTRPNLSMVVNKSRAPASSLVKMAKIVHNSALYVLSQGLYLNLRRFILCVTLAREANFPPPSRRVFLPDSSRTIPMYTFCYSGPPYSSKTSYINKGAQSRGEESKNRIQTNQTLRTSN